MRIDWCFVDGRVQLRIVERLGENVVKKRRRRRYPMSRGGKILIAVETVPGSEKSS
jgi:hypothetical protein